MSWVNSNSRGSVHQNPQKPVPFNSSGQQQHQLQQQAPITSGQWNHGVQQFDNRMQSQPLANNYPYQQENNWNYQNVSTPDHQQNQFAPSQSQTMSSNQQQFQANTAFDNVGNDGWGDWDWNENNTVPQDVSNNQSMTRNNIPYGQVQGFNQQPAPPSQEQHQQQQQMQYPQQYQYKVEPNANQYVNNTQNAILDSFSNDPANSWNWNAEQNEPIAPPQPVFEKVGQAGIKNQLHNSETIPPTNNFESSNPDGMKNTQYANPNLARVMRTDNQLTPQWSTESQMSSNDSESISTNTYTSEENQGIGTVNHVPPLVRPPPPIQNVTNDMDNLDQVLMSINAMPPPAEHIEPSPIVMQSPEIEAAQNIGNNSMMVSHGKPVTHPQKQYAFPPTNEENPSTERSPSEGKNDEKVTVSSVAPIQPLPPVFHAVSSTPVEQPTHARNTPNVSQQRENDQLGGHQSIPDLPPNNQIPIPNSASGGNPFKRTSRAMHKNLNFQPPSQPLPTTMAIPPPPQPITINQSDLIDQVNQESLVPDNSEVPDSIHLQRQNNYEIENHEIAPSNDRNEYLQTDPLSTQEFYIPHSEPQQSNDNLPPPGLSRLVLGQPETAPQMSGPEPPVGLDRMIPGTDVNNMTNRNNQRKGDGEDTTAKPIQRSNLYAATNIPQTVDSMPPPPCDITDRNLYLVLGESETSAQQQSQPLVQAQSQRIVPGLEKQPVGSVIQPIEEPRELHMDGENIEDNEAGISTDQNRPINNKVQSMIREEPIEGANSSDKITTKSSSLNVETESSINLDNGGRLKDLSNPSTCDDSDKDRPYYYKSKRNEDSSRRRQSDRYDSEDSDEYNHRRRYGKDRNSEVRDIPDRDNDRYRNKREKSVNNDRYDQRSDRYYEGSKRDKKYRERHRYETDGSRYETEESSRYDRRDDRRKDRDYDRERNPDDDSDRERKYKHDKAGDRDRRKDDRRGEKGRYRDDEREQKRRYRDRRDRDRRYDYTEDYQRSGSRNTNDRHGNPNYYPPQSGFGPYDPMAQFYQQQQQYYETLRRTNPQAYAEIYKRYYGQVPAGLSATSDIANDGRESVHSGRSSVNGKERYDPVIGYGMAHYYDQRAMFHSSQLPFSQQTNSTMNSTLLESNVMAMDYGHVSIGNRQHYAHSECSNIRNDITSMGKSVNDQEPQRMTPCKFQMEHTTVSLTQGIMVCVKPRYSPNGIGNVLKLLNVCINDSTKKLFNAFPGPLVRGITHKKTIIEFCEEQIRLGPKSSSRSITSSMASLNSNDSTNKASYTLMWKLLILLIRQNGMVVGTDIAELLMKNVAEYPSIVPSRSYRQNDLDDDKELHDDRNSIESYDEVDSSPILKLSEEEITDKFRNYLVYGNVNEALDWATENNLWGHALFLASKVDRRSHANVMMKFANKLALNDPLQTLYQLMSGRTPSSVMSVQDEKWGDWRPHLAMILSNTSHKPELDRKSITILGDSLTSRGDLFGGQFCYLMAQVGFGKYSNVQQEATNIAHNIKLVLLGSSHLKSFNEFAVNESIMMTEIYEYACGLNDDKFSIAEFQPYKYLLATRLLDYGFHLRALMYLEQISTHIEKNPDKYNKEFISKVFTMSDRLKYYDPMMEKNLDPALDSDDSPQKQNPNASAFVEDQKWLQGLRDILQNSNEEFTSNNNYQQIERQESIQYEQDVNQQFMALNQQFQQLNMQYTDSNNIQSNQEPLSYQPQIDAQPPPPTFYGEQQVQEMPQIGLMQPDSSYMQPSIIHHEQQQQNDLSSYNQFQPGMPASYPDIPQQQQHQLPYGSTSEPSSHDPYVNDYWQQQQMNQEISQPASMPTISMPNSVSNKSGYYDETADTDGKTNDGSQRKQSQDKSSTKESKPKRNEQSSSNNTGWFGGIFNKLSLKPKNQMILPDDKNPSIVWDPDKKKWVNTDGDEEHEEALKPPPKMSDLGLAPIGMSAPTMAQSQPPVSQMNSMPLPAESPIDHSNNMQPQSNPMVATDPMKTPNLQSNMFKLQRNRTLKKSYVDVFNPSGAAAKPAETVMAPVMPMSNVPQPGSFFVPGQAPASQPAEGGQPQFYNTNYMVPN